MGLIRRRLPNGQDVTQVDAAEAALLYREIFVEESYRRPGGARPTPGVIFDIGANIGLASMFFKSRYPAAFIVAAEPGPDTYRALEENFARHVPDGLARNVAITAADGHARFGYYPKAPAESGLYTEQDLETALARKLLIEGGVPVRDAEHLATSRHQLSYVECETMTFSRLLRDSGAERADLVKIDVEKAEADVIAGIADDDWAKIDELVVEVHDIDGRLGDIEALLRQRGFDVTDTQERRLADTDLHLTFAVRAV
ncbi:FkbM family methyltransferase [Micromonospora sp. PSH03]|uniref:FkbM family methyltransferase n=1 Tax=Micromonospora salmantinae TaxID=2911211 RepID=UPI001EE7ECBA|nr:FkbM family methyltransferase [Micromonospora salmantinae]MCG5454765.1 FkbM family methyltransferase [Micromonospora salmantinae]